VQGVGCRVQVSGIRVQGSGFRFQGSGFRVQGSGSRVWPALTGRPSRGGLVFEAHRLLHYSTLGLKVMNKKKVGFWEECWVFNYRLESNQEDKT